MFLTLFPCPYRVPSSQNRSSLLYHLDIAEQYGNFAQRHVPAEEGTVTTFLPSSVLNAPRDRKFLLCLEQDLILPIITRCS